MADEIMVEQHMRRPGTPTREHRRSKHRHSRSPTPVPSHSPSSSPNQTPPTSPAPASDQKKPVDQSREDKHNHKPVEFTNHHKLVKDPQPPSSRTIQDTTSTTNINTTKIPSPQTSDLDSSIPDARPKNEPSIKDHHHHHHIIAERIKDKGSSGYRKRSPSPNSVAPPYPKRTNNKDILRTENITKIANEKSPSPSPLMTPIRQTGLSSASQVLNEEFKRKQTTKNLKLKQIICKEIRKNSKS